MLSIFDDTFRQNVCAAFLKGENVNNGDINTQIFGHDATSERYLLTRGFAVCREHDGMYQIELTHLVESGEALALANEIARQANEGDQLFAVQGDKLLLGGEVAEHDGSVYLLMLMDCGDDCGECNGS